MSTDQPSSHPVCDRIVVGIDGSELSKQALGWAGFLAAATGSTLEAVAVWQPVTAFNWAGAGGAAIPFPDDWNPAEDARKGLAATLDEVFGEHSPPGMDITLREGNPAQVLLEVSADARMLVIGSRGHGGFANLLLGSVSAACTEHATCPVLVVHGITKPPPPMTSPSGHINPEAGEG